MLFIHCQCIVRIITGSNMRLFAYSFQYVSTVAHSVCVWVDLHMCMCAEWEQGHSWGLGFLSKHHLQAFLHLIVKPPLPNSRDFLLSMISCVCCVLLFHLSLLTPQCCPISYVLFVSFACCIGTGVSQEGNHRTNK